MYNIRKLGKIRFSNNLELQNLEYLWIFFLPVADPVTGQGKGRKREIYFYHLILQARYHAPFPWVCRVFLFSFCFCFLPFSSLLWFAAVNQRCLSQLPVYIDIHVGILKRCTLATMSQLRERKSVNWTKTSQIKLKEFDTKN